MQLNHFIECGGAVYIPQIETYICYKIRFSRFSDTMLQIGMQSAPVFEYLQYFSFLRSLERCFEIKW